MLNLKPVLVLDDSGYERAPITTPECVKTSDGNGIQKFLSNPNLLDNSNFSNPVNQRQSNTYTGTGVYCIDRWKLWGTYSVSGKTISFSSANTITTAHGTYCQIYEKLTGVGIGIGDIVTISADIDGVRISKTIVISSDASGSIVDFGNIKLNVFYTPAIDVLGIAFCIFSGSCTIDNIKLEKGPFPTPYVPKGYGVELAECQRYSRVAFISIGAERSANTMLNYDMRIVPTFAVLNQIAGTFYPVFSNVTKQSCEVSIPIPTTNYWVGTYFLSADL